MKKLEVVVVHDIFMTATCKYADIVLLASTFFEKAEIDAVSLKKYRWIQIKRRIVEPLGEAKSEAEFIMALAKKMGYQGYFPYSSEDDVLKELLKGTEVKSYPFQELEKGVLLENLVGEIRKNGFPTPSRKIELFPEILKKMKMQELSPVDFIQVKSGEYPYLLITGARVMPYYHSQFRNIEPLKRLIPEPVAEVGREISEREGISDGDFIRIKTKYGELEIKALIKSEMHPYTISIPHGWENCNANLLTANIFEPLTGAPTYRAIPCRIEPVRS